MWNSTDVQNLLVYKILMQTSYYFSLHKKEKSKQFKEKVEK